jgi:hypothetical protein
VAFAITGFGGQQLKLVPQLFQALSLGGGRPAPIAPAYGSPNPNLVPVSRAAGIALPANLTVAAQPVFAAILNLGVVGQSQPGVPSPPNSTAAVDAQNPSVQDLSLAPSGTQVATVPQGPVSFTLTTAPAYVTSGLDALTGSLPTRPSAPLPGPQQSPSAPPTASAPPRSPGPVSAAQYIAPSSPTLVGRISATVAQLAIAAIYRAPVFSFLA